MENKDFLVVIDDNVLNLFYNINKMSKEEYHNDDLIVRNGIRYLHDFFRTEKNYKKIPYLKLYQLTKTLNSKGIMKNSRGIYSFNKDNDIVKFMLKNM